MILSLLRSPSSYRHEPLEYWRNQFLHMLAVGVFPMLIHIGAFAGLIILYIWWEWYQWKHEDAEDFDAFEDMAFVSTGAVAVFTMEPLVLICGGLFLVSGYLLRKGNG